MSLIVLKTGVSKILITGASSGIGEAVAYAFSDFKCQLFLVARRQEQLNRVAESCLQKGAAQVIRQKHDLSLSGQGTIIVQECLQALGGLDILICNAGYGIYGPTANISPDQMSRIWQVNYQSGYESIHAALPHFLSRREGHIVLVSSVIGKQAIPFSATYCATKFAQVGLGNAMWGELKEHGVGVSVICPGATATEFQESSHKVENQQSTSWGHAQNPMVVARAIVQAVQHKKREIHLTTGGKILCFLERLVPSLTIHAITWILNRRQTTTKTGTDEN